MLLRYVRIARPIGLESPHFDTQVPKAIKNAKDVGLIDQVASQRCDAVNILLLYPVEPVGEPFAKSSRDPNAEPALVPLLMAVIPHVVSISDNRGVLHPPAPKPPGVIPGADVIKPPVVGRGCAYRRTPKREGKHGHRSCGSASGCATPWISTLELKSQVSSLFAGFGSGIDRVPGPGGLTSPGGAITPGIR